MPSANDICTATAVDGAGIGGHDPGTRRNRRATVDRAGTDRAVSRLIRFLETGSAPDGLFAPDVFADLSLPLWRIQAGTAEEVVAVRLAGHPAPGSVRVERMEYTDHGFTIEFEERWEDGGRGWYSREMIRADVVDGSITSMSIYCTGDWDEDRQREHAGKIALIRP